MTDREKLLKVLEEIGVDHHECSDDYADRIIVRNESYDVEERSFEFKFDKSTGEYFEE
jgi:hypothetical protein